ncbi:bacteriochlorophyll 4-vinyl reductase [Roseivivax isoporae]|uniref:Bacteriochlorophyll 4-vinyl reductase n=1 Tax=Roseivivax isoporae LMG 25204 TaxID=1449351 RepID=X7F748_9RHOB|nr:bacteriochlorophyll 4-vinyl reductase [Roseivivax isoporae]ETX28615.1 hypothetical protein RISW2_05845 [Roseivivax isoporae LMG 25204]
MTDAGGVPARIGPNAVTRLLDVLERRCPRDARARILARAGIARAPSGDAMIAEDVAVRLHRAVRAEVPRQADALLAEAGRQTARYILGHRIPGPARWLLRALPVGLSARLLSRAIARHAWTFAGSARFSAAGPFGFEIRDNAFVRGTRGDGRLCTWHAAVIGELYRALVAKGCDCAETACAVERAGDICRFELRTGTGPRRADRDMPRHP